MIVVASISFVMVFFVEILPEEAQIEAVQRAIFHETTVKERKFDRTKIDLNQIASLAQFKAHESAIELNLARSNMVMSPSSPRNQMATPHKQLITSHDEDTESQALTESANWGNSTTKGHQERRSV